MLVGVEVLINLLPLLLLHREVLVLVNLVLFMLLLLLQDVKKYRTDFSLAVLIATV